MNQNSVYSTQYTNIPAVIKYIASVYLQEKFYNPKKYIIKEHSTYVKLTVYILDIKGEYEDLYMGVSSEPSRISPFVSFNLNSVDPIFSKR